MKEVTEEKAGRSIGKEQTVESLYSADDGEKIFSEYITNIG